MEKWEEKFKNYLLEAQRDVLVVVDDNRNPSDPKVKKYIDSFQNDNAKNLPVVWLKNNNELRSWVNTNGTPKAITFDKMRKRKGEEDGLEAARFFIDYIGQDNLDLPMIGIHSGSPEGQAELAQIFNTYRTGGEVPEPEVKPDTKPTTPTSTEPRPEPAEPDVDTDDEVPTDVEIPFDDSDDEPIDDTETDDEEQPEEEEDEQEDV